MCLLKQVVCKTTLRNLIFIHKRCCECAQRDKIIHSSETFPRLYGAGSTTASIAAASCNDATEYHLSEVLSYVAESFICCTYLQMTQERPDSSPMAWNCWSREASAFTCPFSFAFRPGSNHS
jgi:hypothetical protein